MPAQAMCISHGGLINARHLVTADILAEIDAQFETLRDSARRFDPQIVIQFGNDHNSGMALKLMPPFMVALRAEALGDFDTSRGPFSIAEEVGRELVSHLHDTGIDVATTYKGRLDHGFTMALDKIFGGIDRVPVVPIFTNCGGDLRPPPHRSLALGSAVGHFMRSRFPDVRTLFLGSGGLSHDPPLPDFKTSPPDVQERMIEGVEWTEESLKSRTAKVIASGLEHARGEGDLQALNPDWDQRMLLAFEHADLEMIASQTDADIGRAGGRGAAEIRNWIGALAAMRSYGGGRYATHGRYYRAVPSWISGFAKLQAGDATAVR